MWVTLAGWPTMAIQAVPSWVVGSVPVVKTRSWASRTLARACLGFRGPRVRSISWLSGPSSSMIRAMISGLFGAAAGEVAGIGISMRLGMRVKQSGYGGNLRVIVRVAYAGEHTPEWPETIKHDPYRYRWLGACWPLVRPGTPGPPACGAGVDRPGDCPEAWPVRQGILQGGDCQDLPPGLAVGGGCGQL